MADPVVYFLASAGRIKIGHTVDIEQRIRTLSVASADPLTLLATVRAPRRTEAALHSYLSEHRIAGEWFRDCPEVREVMLRVSAGNPEFPHQICARRRPDANVAWASDALKALSGPRALGESTKDAIRRAASRADLSYWRAFDIWYRKARRLDLGERDAIAKAVETIA